MAIKILNYFGRELLENESGLLNALMKLVIILLTIHHWTVSDKITECSIVNGEQTCFARFARDTIEAPIFIECIKVDSLGFAISLFVYRDPCLFIPLSHLSKFSFKNIPGNKITFRLYAFNYNYEATAISWCVSILIKMWSLVAVPSL